MENLSIVLGVVILFFIAVSLYETRKRHCNICGQKISPFEGKLCGGCYVEEMLAGRLPDRRRRDE
ncbi:hypothetical protein HZB04_02195 [Candidatus Wolfebacteria bacterium]|nr:hypothetical protein [Candidatus Wolfebacteria bacterium]